MTHDHDRVSKHEVLTRLFRGVSSFELQYMIKVPRNARLIIDHDSGNVHVDDVIGNVQVKNGVGQITLHLPEQGHYAFGAKCDLGAVDSLVHVPTPFCRRGTAYAVG